MANDSWHLKQYYAYMASMWFSLLGIFLSISYKENAPKSFVFSSILLLWVLGVLLVTTGKYLILKSFQISKNNTN